MKKKVPPVKGKGNKESGSESGAKTKKKLAVKTNEVKSYIMEIVLELNRFNILSQSRRDIFLKT